MSSGEMNFIGVLSLTRFMLALKYLNSDLKSEDVWFLADHSKCGSLEEEGEVKTKSIAF